jgi:hypothetical protein
MAAPQRPVALDQRDGAHAHAGDVRDRVERPGPERADADAELAGARHLAHPRRRPGGD